jgi:hypothetical protein
MRDRAYTCSEETFRYIDQKDWFGRTMPLLRTKYRGDLMAGLVLCMGSQIVSVVSVLPDLRQEYCTDNLLVCHGI